MARKKAAARGMRKASAREGLDIDNEEDVAAEMAKALDVEADNLIIKSDRGYESFGAGTVWSINVARGGHKEWHVVADDDVANALAIEIVKQDLEQEPELFEKSFIENHIDTKALKDALWSDVHSMTYDDLSEAAERDPEDFWRQAESFDLPGIPEEDEDGNRRDPKSGEIDELADRITGDRLEDPMGYLEDIYGKEDAVKQAIEIAGIDIDDAAEEAVSADGAGHFLGTYDGETRETPGGFVYWRSN